MKILVAMILYQTGWSLRNSVRNTEPYRNSTAMSKTIENMDTNSFLLVDERHSIVVIVVKYVHCVIFQMICINTSQCTPE